MVSPGGDPFAKRLYRMLATEIEPLIAQMNGRLALMKNQPGPIAEHYGELDVNEGEDPRYNYIVAYGTDPETFPAIVVKLATGDDDQEIGWLMAEIPVRVMVRIFIDSDDIDKSAVSVWVYDKNKRQADCIQKPEPLSTPSGRILLWASDFLSVDDRTLPDDYQRPYKNQ